MLVKSRYLHGQRCQALRRGAIDWLKSRAWQKWSLCTVKGMAGDRRDLGVAFSPFVPSFSVDFSSPLLLPRRHLLPTASPRNQQQHSACTVLHSATKWKFSPLPPPLSHIPSPLGPSSYARHFWIFQHDCQFASFNESRIPNLFETHMIETVVAEAPEASEETKKRGNDGRQATGHYTPCHPINPRPQVPDGSSMVHRNSVRGSTDHGGIKPSSRLGQAMTHESSILDGMQGGETGTTGYQDRRPLRLLFRHACYRTRVAD